MRDIRTSMIECGRNWCAQRGGKWVVDAAQNLVLCSYAVKLVSIHHFLFFQHLHRKDGIGALQPHKVHATNITTPNATYDMEIVLI